MRQFIAGIVAGVILGVLIQSPRVLYKHRLTTDTVKIEVPVVLEKLNKQGLTLELETYDIETLPPVPFPKVPIQSYQTEKVVPEGKVVVRSLVNGALLKQTVTTKTKPFSASLGVVYAPRFIAPSLLVKYRDHQLGVAYNYHQLSLHYHHKLF